MSPVVQGLREQRFFAGRQTFSQDASYLFRLGRELLHGVRLLSPLGPCLLVTGFSPAGWSWNEASAVCRAMGAWCAAQGFGVLTLGEGGLAEALAASCERAGGRALRCGLAGAPGSDVSRVEFRLELARRISCAKHARATLALSPTGESAGTLHFLHALAGFERMTDHRVLLLGSAQWEPSIWDSFLRSRRNLLATQLIEGVSDLGSALDFS